MGFNSGFKGLIIITFHIVLFILGRYKHFYTYNEEWLPSSVAVETEGTTPSLQQPVMDTLLATFQPSFRLRRLILKDLYSILP